MTRKLFVLSLLLTTLFLLFGCANAQPVFVAGTPTPTVTPPPTASPVPTLTPTPTPAPITVGLDPALPEIYVKPLTDRLQAQPQIELNGQQHPLVLVEEESEAVQVLLTFGPLSLAGEVVAERFYALAVPFATVMDGAPLAEVMDRWQGESPDPLIISDYAGVDLSAILGETALSPTQAMTLPMDLAATPGAWAILPFQELDPSLKVLHIDGVNLLDNRLDPATYPLAVAVSVTGESEAAKAVADAAGRGHPARHQPGRRPGSPA